MRNRSLTLVVLSCTLALHAGCGGDDPPGPAIDGGGTDAGGAIGDSGMLGMDAGPQDGAATAGCGDGVPQRGEACDDGNTVDGDGCSADCSSDETCGNSILDIPVGEQCDDGNTMSGDGCRGDCLSDYRCGNGVVDTIASGASVDETCDDGNTVNGDGCSAACDSNEMCGNNVVDTAAGEVCDDGNTVGGDACSADCHTSLLCGNGAVDPPEECDDSNTTAGDGCDGSCHIERCGNGRVDSGEVCDDGNAVDGDGCDGDCTWTCAADADCADLDVCNGAETCTSPSTLMSHCTAGTAAADGTVCGGGRVCMAGVCTTVGCGDSIVTAPEQCDDGNTTSGDGCDSDCTWTCAAAADCSDANACNGTETCTSPSTLMSRCSAGTPPATGTVCDRDMMPATRDICRMSMCLASVCGDTYVDAATTLPEQCDDGNAVSGDGCSATCQTETMVTPPTGFRVTNLDLVSPRIVVVPVLGCNDVTQAPVFGFSVNGSLDTAIAPMSAMGNYSLHIASLFKPLGIGGATSPLDVHMNAACMEAPTPDSCGPDATMPDVIVTIANNRSVGTCYAPVAADVNTRAGAPGAYAPTANTVSAPCFVSDESTLTVSISGIMIPLQYARFAATYSGSPTNRLVTGVVTGFLSETAAADVILPASLPLIGGDSLYQHLQAGNRTARNTAGMVVADGCNVGGGTSEDDADTVMGVRGFWFFLNFEGDRITWTGP